MNKITRVLLLYSRLVKGEAVNKMLFCFENECSSRSFDRDIEDIRLFLSDSFSLLELRYDRVKNNYCIDGETRQKLEPMEYLFIERILKDTAVLRKDEFGILSDHLLSNTEHILELKSDKQKMCESYNPPFHNKALLKMHGDMVSIITKKQCIRIRYFKSDSKEIERDIIPCTVKYDLGYLYLIGFRIDENDEYPAYYRLDRIYSFMVIRGQSHIEQERAITYMEKYSSGITQMYGGQFREIILSCRKNYFSYIYDKFGNVEILCEDDNFMVVKFGAFEDGFVKWLISQSQDMISVIEPEDIKNKIMKQAKEILRKYGGVE